MEHTTAFEYCWDFLTRTTKVLSCHFVFSPAANLHNIILIMTLSTFSRCAAMFLKTQVLFQNRFIIEITKCGGTEPVSGFALLLLLLPLRGNSFIFLVKIPYFNENTFMKEYSPETLSRKCVLFHPSHYKRRFAWLHLSSLDGVESEVCHKILNSPHIFTSCWFLDIFCNLSKRSHSLALLRSWFSYIFLRFLTGILPFHVIFLALSLHSKAYFQLVIIPFLLEVTI